MIIVEKEGITDVLVDAAQKYRIALVATAGHFTEYVTDLMRLASGEIFAVRRRHQIIDTSFSSASFRPILTMTLVW